MGVIYIYGLTKTDIKFGVDEMDELIEAILGFFFEAPVAASGILFGVVLGVVGYIYLSDGWIPWVGYLW